MKLNVFSSAPETACALIRYIIAILNAEPKKIFSIAFSGGTTPSVMYDIWANEYRDVTPWERIRFFWVDERCVRPNHSDSNFGVMNSLLLSQVPVINEQIYRIHGEADPLGEAKRYSKLVGKLLPKTNNLPTFDLVLLGVGEDGHTSSIFPGQEALLVSPHTYVVSRNPYDGQKRVALTGQPIINAKRTVFLVTGEKKVSAVKDICNPEGKSPAAYIARNAQNVELFMDFLHQ
ncbi:6-phosphogluconolactonase [Bacteroides sp. 214]|uniref:6-phosphogluconolactonase n=1 Tax=Bacteroides sp. 214 TaxID=2302935 RepID=UPI0013D315AB|nr:6-phosphogluconolactonase [Bacteroides sp. 214]NDW11346.1 6-phosphogluconolactonase [Bacteroides sp. 214]